MHEPGEAQPVNDDPLAGLDPPTLPTRLIPAGTRVGAIAFFDDETLDLYGYGTMIEDALPPADGLPGCEILRAAGLPVPAIRLDSGEIVYGPECSFAEAAVVARLCLHRTVQPVSITVLRTVAR